MRRRKLREEVFKLLFELELISNDVETRIADIVAEEDIKKPEDIEFLRTYINGITENREYLEKEIKEKLIGWSFESIGNIEKVLLKLSFYEILVMKLGYEIVINEAVELAKLYGDEKTPEFINGVLADLAEKL